MKRSTFFFFPILALIALAGCSATAPLASAPVAFPAPASPPPASELASEATATVFVVERGWHTDIGLPTAEIHLPLSQAASGWASANFVLFGFGDRRYVLKRTTNIFDMVAALFPAPGALLVSGYTQSLEAAFPAPDDEVLQLPVTQAQLDDLEQSLWRYFDRGSDERPVMIGTGPYADSTFYATPAIYDAFFTCNTWVAGLLEKTGLPVRSSGVLFAGQVMEQARPYATAVTSGRPTTP